MGMSWLSTVLGPGGGGGWSQTTLSATPFQACLAVNADSVTKLSLLPPLPPSPSLPPSLRIMVEAGMASWQQQLNWLDDDEDQDSDTDSKLSGSAAADSVMWV